MFQFEQKSPKDSGSAKNSNRDDNSVKSELNYAEMLHEQNKAMMKNSNPAQMMVKEEEEKPIQGKTLQKMNNPEEEELLQGKIAQKQDTSEEEEEIQAKKSKSKSNEAIPSAIKTQMPENIQTKMENSFGTSFNGVNIHQNDASASQMGALAYTQGSNIHFAPGMYNPNSQKGQELLGHELTHVVQQRQGRVSETKQSKGVSVNDSPTLEKEADDMGKKAANGQTVGQAEGLFSADNNSIQMKTPQEKVKEFQSKKYSKELFTPSTQRGIFDVSLNPINGRLEVKVKVNMNYLDGDATKFTGLKGQSEKWTDAEKKKWSKDFITLLEGRWGGKFHFINPDLPGVTVYADVEIEEVTKDWHYQLNVTKIPKGKMKQSSITHYNYKSSGKLVSKLNKHHGELDSEDLSFIDKNKGTSEKQKGAVHEFGHMIGLDDEYPTKDKNVDHSALVLNALGKKVAQGYTNNIMSVGNTIEKQHYVTFLEALQTVTSDNKWKFKP